MRIEKRFHLVPLGGTPVYDPRAGLPPLVVDYIRKPSASRRWPPFGSNAGPPVSGCLRSAQPPLGGPLARKSKFLDSVDGSLASSNVVGFHLLRRWRAETSKLLDAVPVSLAHR